MEAAIGLGSNLGDRLANLREACGQLESLASGCQILRKSRVYESDPVQCPPDSAAFLNAAVLLETEASPFNLLQGLQAIERSMGRPSARERNAPRTIDLDLLHCGQIVVKTDELVLPHPRLHQRRFVLAPLADIDPDCLLPGFGDTVAKLLQDLPPGQSVTPAQGQL